MRTGTKILVFLAVGIFGSAWTGAGEQESEHFPPNPQVQWKHLRLDLRIPDLDDAVMEGRATYTVAAAGQRVESLRLDATDLKVESVREGGSNGIPLEWCHENEVLQIRLREPLEPALSSMGSPDVTFVIDYSVRDPSSGMTFSSAIPGVDGRSAVPAEVHTQGQTQQNHHWFPVHDFPNIRLSTEIVVNVPAGVSASSNGRLVGHWTDRDREIWHWQQSKPHVPYLVSLVAGHFQRTELPTQRSGVPMAVWTRPDHAPMVQGTYGNTDRMMGCFARVFTERYPWDRYDQLVVRNFGAGGMENTSATTMHSGALLDSTALLEGDIDGLISHELCHQWTGDLMTCKSWEHLWLNEGWATYGTALWMEERDGVDGYYDAMLGDAGVADHDSGAAQGNPPVAPQPMCSRVYNSPGETFGRAANPYPKGASILHMLRRMLGDAVFFQGVAIYVDRFAGKTVETDDFRGCLEEVSGRSLEQFFEQWCFRPGCPLVKVGSAYDAASKMLTIDVEQKNRAGGAALMAFALPVMVRTATSEKVLSIAVTGAQAQAKVELDGPPVMIAVDPTLDVLKVLEVTTASPLLIEQMKHGPTSASRRQAVRALRATDTEEVRSALAVQVREPSASFRLRVEAAEALAAFGSTDARAVSRELFDQLVKPTLGKSVEEAARACHPQLRAALTESIAVAPFEEALPRLTSVLESDGGYAPRVAAAAGIGRMGGVDFPTQREALVKDLAIQRGLEKMLLVATPNEKVRSAALAAIEAIHLVALRGQVEELATLGHAERMRPAAISALAALATDESEVAVRTQVASQLIAYLDDPESRARGAAGDGLVAMRYEEALSKLDAMAVATVGNPRMRERAAEWASKIRAATAPKT